MSWLRTTSLSFARQLSRSLDPRSDYEPQACYSSFCKHWQQAHDIILKSHPHNLHDDVLAVVNHLEQLSTLLVLEARAREAGAGARGVGAAAGEGGDSCLEFLLSENVLHQLYEWAVVTGKYENAVRLEQLKIYGSLVSHYSTQVIAAEPFLRPLLKLLSGFRNELPPPNVEAQLVSVLNQLCVALMQNMKFIDLFFLTTHSQHGSQAEFIIVRLLLSSVHREGRTGAAARDALLLCAKMSALSAQLAEYMLASNTCPVLATGLSGLYSLLPRALPRDCVRLTPDHVNTMHKLALFIDSLEFCNAVAQVAHPSITKHLLDLLYQGFLVPVMGPALLQTRPMALQSGAPEQTAATGYLELIVRSVTARGLLRTVLEFLLKYEYDGVGLLHVLMTRLDGESQLSLIALSLMETLIDLNSEDVMLELIFKYLLNGHHLAPSLRNRISEPEIYRETAFAYLSLAPNICTRPLEKTRKFVEELEMSGRRVLEFPRHDDGRRYMNGVSEGIAMDNLVKEVKFNYGNPNESLIGNYHAYLCDARFEIVSRCIACQNWTSKYDQITQPKREANNNKETKEIDIPHSSAREPDSLISICTSGYETLKTSDTSEKEPHSLTSLVEDIEPALLIEMLKSNADLNKELDSLTSFGSSGDDSLKCRLDDEDSGFSEDLFAKTIRKVESGGRHFDGDVPMRSWRASAESIVGPLLANLLRKAALLLESDLTQNLRVTCVLSKLLCLPTPLVTSLMTTGAVPPNVPSLFQIVSKLKQEVDELTASLSNARPLVDRARLFLVHREMALVRSRHAADEAPSPHPAESPRARDEPPPRRGEGKRRSLSDSLSNMFGRRLSTSSPSSSPQSSHAAPHAASPQRRPDFMQEEYWNQSITLRTILNAVVLDEWLKELAALAEEHALRLTTDNFEDSAYVRSVAL
ncbi:hypothetical protein JYU34_005055 [Plutella xylostella]|uniref:FHF complex subunit HOOK-interacting protein C-terminal domain-containing protein n=1 Tax=Plutella xylostella TaxID=51655 RepID=A0ABQ7QVT5_PLUXY|nr:hypothetical protein JYU34_005055 [Plutella xylostella]